MSKRKQKMIADSGIGYNVMFRRKLVELTHASSDHIIWLVRQAVQELPVAFWDNNERIARRKGFQTEGLDCFHMDFGEVGSHIYVVEVVPYPRGTLMIILRDVPDIQPDRDDPDTICFHSSVLRDAPVKTIQQLGVTKAMIDLE